MDSEVHLNLRCVCNISRGYPARTAEQKLHLSLAALDPFEPLIAAGLELIYGEDFQTVILHHACFIHLSIISKMLTSGHDTAAAAITHLHMTVYHLYYCYLCGDNYGCHPAVQSIFILFACQSAEGD